MRLSEYAVKLLILPPVDLVEQVFMADEKEWEKLEMSQRRSTLSALADFLPKFLNFGDATN